MATSVLDMSMSLDGYIAGPNDDIGNPGGDGFARLHEWLFTPDGSAFRTDDSPSGRLVARAWRAGAVITGRRTAEQVEHWGGDHNGMGVPVFVPSHRPPDPVVAGYPLINYVDGIESAMAQAKAAAGERHVHVIGAYTGRRAIEAGVLDELQIHVIPVLFGGGRRLFDVLPSRVELEVAEVLDTPEATHIRYRIPRLP